MNKIYKVIWSKVRNCYVVVSEMAKRNGKCSSSLNKKIIASFLAAGLLTALPMSVDAEEFNEGTGVTDGGDKSNNNAWGVLTYADGGNSTAWGNLSSTLGFSFTRSGEPVTITYNSTSTENKFVAYDSTNTRLASGETMQKLVGNLLKLSSVTFTRKSGLSFMRNGKPVTITYNRTEEKFVAYDSDGVRRASGETLKEVENKLLAFSTVTYTFTPLNATAFGSATIASGLNSTAFGERTFASSNNSTAFGARSKATANQATAFGFKTEASADNATAWGHETTASDKRATAFGIETTASGRNSTSFGYSTTASGENATAFGSGTVASGGGATSWGTDTQAKAETSTTWGNSSIVHAGRWNDSNGNLLYSDVEVLRDTSLPSGEQYYIVGIDSNGERVIIQEKIATRAIADNLIKENGRIAGYNSTAFGMGSQTYAENSLAALGGKVGQDNSNDGLNSAAIGLGADVKSSNSYAMGRGATIGKNSNGSVALGGNGKLKFKDNDNDTEYSDLYVEKLETITKEGKTTKYAIIGIDDEGKMTTLASSFDSREAALNKIAADNPDHTKIVGNATNAFAAVGGQVLDSATSAIAIGNGSKAQKQDSVALGSGSVANRPAGDPYAGWDPLTGKASEKEGETWLSTAAAVSVGGGTIDGKTVTRQITGVAAGIEPTDAVNVAQLQQVHWNLGVKNSAGTDVLDVETTKIGNNGINKVKFIAGKGMDLTTITLDKTAEGEGYGIKLNPDFQGLTYNADNEVTGIYYKGTDTDHYFTISTPTSSGGAKVSTDHRSVSAETVPLTYDGVTEDYRIITSPFLNMEGLADPNDKYKPNLDIKTIDWAYATGSNSIAMGRDAESSGDNSLAIGYISEATQKNATSLGYKAHALASNSVSLGVATFTTGTRGIAIGTSGHINQLDEKPDYERTWAAGEGSITLGTEARAVTESKRFSGKTEVDHDTNDAVAIGTRSDARATNSIALGGNMSYTNPETGHTTYGKQKGNDRDFGATVGEGAKSAIAIGGAYGTQVKNDKGDITALDVTYEAAATYGQRSIAVGTGATVANAEKFLELKSMVDDISDGGYQKLRAKYYEARAYVTVKEKALREYVRAHGEDGSDDYKSLVNKLEDANTKLTEATVAFSNKIKEKVDLETKNAESVEDAVAIGTAARSEIAGGMALGSNSKIGYLDREGSSSTLTGYDVRTGLGYADVDSDSPAWKSTAASVAVGGGTVDGTLVTRRISYVAAGVFDTDAVNVEQLKRATNYTSDNRALAITEDSSGSMQLTSPFIHIEGISDASEKFGIASYDNANDFKNVLNSEFTNLTNKRDGYIAEIFELDKKIGNLNNKLQAAEAGRGTKYDEDQADYLVNEYKRLIAEAEQEKQFLKGRRDSTAAARQDLLDKYGSSAGDSLDSGKIEEAYEEALKLKNERAQAIGKDSIAAGKGSKAIGKDSIAIGRKSVVGKVDQTDMGNQSLAIGTENTVTGNNSVGVGTGLTLTGKKSIGIGTGHKVYGEESGTMGDPNVLAANYSYVIGNTNSIGNTEYKDGDTITTENIFIMGNYNVIPEGQQHVYVLGSDTIATASRSVILGDRSGYVEKDYKSNDIETAGTTAGSDGYNKMVVNGKEYKFAGGDSEGVDVPKTVVGVVSVGYRDPSGKEVFNTRRIQNVAPGLISAESTDAINGSQLYQAIKALTIDVVAADDKSAKVEKSTSNTGDSTGGGGTGTTYTVAASTTELELGANATVNKNLKLDVEYPTADPKSYKYTIDMSNNLELGPDGSVTAGDTKVNKDGLTVGDTTVNNSGVTIANGPSMTKDGINAADKKITNVGSGLEGENTDTNAANIKDVKDLATVVKEGEKTKVTSSTDDNGRFTYTVDLNDDAKATLDKAENKGLTFQADDGKDTGAIKLNETLQINGASNIRTEATAGQMYIKLNENVDLGDTGSLRVGNTTVNNSGVTIANGPSMTDKGIDAGGKPITNVEKGVADTDAVNVAQLKEYVGDVPNLGNQISNVDNRARKGIAGAAALAALHPMDFDPDDKLTFAAGMGHYRGESAAALGMFYRPDEKVMFSVGGTLGNGENMINAGVSFSLDRTPRVTGSRTALTKEVVQLREHVAKQDAQIAELTALVRQLAGNAGLQVPTSSALPTEGPALFADNLDNKWVYDAIEDLEQRGYFNGYAGRSLTRQQIAAALDMAMSGGAKLDERIVKEFEPELSHVRVAHVEGKGNNEGEWYERPRASHDKYEDKHKIEKKPFRMEEKKVTSKS